MKTLGWVLYWLVYQVLSIPLTVLGVLPVVILASMKAWISRPSRNPLFLGKVVTAWKWEPWTLIWGNDEDGVSPDGTRLGAIKWYLRNPTNNMRLLPGASSLAKSPKFKDFSWGYIAVDTDGRWCINIKGHKFGFLMNRDAKEGWRMWPVFS